MFFFLIFAFFFLHIKNLYELPKIFANFTFSVKIINFEKNCMQVYNKGQIFNSIGATTFL